MLRFCDVAMLLIHVRPPVSPVSLLPGCLVALPRRNTSTSQVKGDLTGSRSMALGMRASQRVSPSRCRTLPLLRHPNMLPRIRVHVGVLVVIVLTTMMKSSGGPRIRSASAFVPHPTPVVVPKSRIRPHDNPAASASALFGIKGFRGWFEKTFPSAVVPIPKSTGASPDEQHGESFDHVLIDANQLLHIAMRRSKSPSHALMMMIKELDKLLALASPRRSVVLALDGPPSAAKLATQRSRRYGILQRGELQWRT